MDKKGIFEELKFEIGALKSFEEYENSIILGTGNIEGKIMFIGDDFDLYEGENYKVKPSSSGEFLIKLCDIVGIVPENYYITTLTKCKKKYRELEENEKEVLKDCLHTQIALINPKIIVGLGEDVFSLLKEKEIKFIEKRGKIEKWKGDIQLLLTYDANFAKKSRDDGGKRAKVAMEFWGDLKTIKNFVQES